MPTDPPDVFVSSAPLGPGQRAELVVASRDGSEIRVVYETDRRIQAPNWSPDGRWLVFNLDGRLWRLAADGSGTPVEIDTAPIEDIDTDHAISPDGHWIYISSMDGHIYRLPFEGGTPERVSNDHPPSWDFRHYLHSVSHDGTMLTYASLETHGPGPITRIWTIPATGGDDSVQCDGTMLADGAEFSPDGRTIWFNAEPHGAAEGHAQLFRKPVDVMQCEQVTVDDRVNWFPHPAPDGTLVAYLSYPPGTERGHPFDRDVIIRTMHPDGTGIRDIDAFTGGQGTMNVASWAPDSSAFAYVRYPFAD